MIALTSSPVVAVLVVAVFAAAGTGQSVTQSSDRELEGLLASALAGMPATTGVAVTHLASGRSAAVRGDQAFSPASVSKLPYLVRAIQLAERGELDLTRRTTLTRAHLRHGTGILQYHDAGLAPTLGDLVTEMVITSDNTATDLVVDAIGGVDAVNTWLTASGFAETQSFGRPDAYRRALLTLLDPAFATLTAEETTGLLYTRDGNPLAARYLPIFSGAKARWLGVVTDPANRRRFAEAASSPSSSALRRLRTRRGLLSTAAVFVWVSPAVWARPNSARNAATHVSREARPVLVDRFRVARAPASATMAARSVTVISAIRRSPNSRAARRQYGRYVAAVAALNVGAISAM